MDPLRVAPRMTVLGMAAGMTARVRPVTRMTKIREAGGYRQSVCLLRRRLHKHDPRAA